MRPDHGHERRRRKPLAMRPRLRVERWRLSLQWRVFYGWGYPQFEFVFIVGRPKRDGWTNPEPLEVDDGFGI